MSDTNPRTPITCAEAEALIDRAQAGEADEAERERLLDHLDGCPACSELFELIGHVASDAVAAWGELPDPTEAELAGVRRRVLAGLGERGATPSRPASVAAAVAEADGEPGRQAKTAGGAPGRRQPFRSGFVRRRLARPALAAAAALLCAVLGYLAGTAGGPADRGDSGETDSAASANGRGSLGYAGGATVDRGGTGPTAGEEVALLATRLRDAAVRHTTFEQVSDSPFVFSNVATELRPDGRVRLAFDAARHLDLVVDRSDPLLAEVLTQTLVEPAPLGTRLAAIELADQHLQPKIERALVIAMLGDESLVVRLRAQQILAELAGDPEVTEAMLGLLAGEPNVQMRLVAVDYLAAQQLGRDRLDAALARRDAAGQPDDAAVLLRAVSREPEGDGGRP